MFSRPWNSRPDGPNEGQKFANDLTQKIGALQRRNRHLRTDFESNSSTAGKLFARRDCDGATVYKKERLVTPRKETWSAAHVRTSEIGEISRLDKYATLSKMRSMRRNANSLSGTRASRRTRTGITITAVLLAISVVLTYRFWDCLSAGESYGSTLRNVAVIIAGLVALPLAITRILVVSNQADTAEGSLANDRYQRGAEMLGHEQEMVRIGGIDALREVAQQYPDLYVRPVMRLLCAFLFKHCENKQQIRNVPRFANRDDLQAAIETVASFRPDQRGTYQEGETQRHLNLGFITFSNATLSGINLAGLDFRSSQFSLSNLSGVDFSRANLRASKFHTVSLNGAILDGANIGGAQFSSEVKGLTQRQLDQAVADEDQAPILDKTLDHETGEPLVWNPS